MKTVKILLVFPQSITNKPITCHMIRRFNINVNILHADIGANKQGRMVLELYGNEEDINNSRRYLDENDIYCKVLEKNIIKDDEQCVDCGACTGVCPGEALYFEKSDWSVAYDNEKCLVCGQCIKVCPLKAITAGEGIYNV